MDQKDSVKERVIVFYKNPEEEDLVRNQLAKLLSMFEPHEDEWYLNKIAEHLELALMYYDKAYPEHEN